MRVVLINVPQKFKKFEENLKTVSEDFGVYPPLNLAYIAAVLEKSNHSVTIIDANALKLVSGQALELAIGFKPDLLGFNIHSLYNFQETIRWIKYFKRKTGLDIIVGGLNLKLYPDEILSYKEIDFAYMGSISNSFMEFIQLYEKKEDFTHVSGLCYRKGGKMHINKPKSWAEDIDKLPLPARHLLPVEKYFQFISKRKNFTVMLSAVGCPYGCTFCCIPLMKYKNRAVKNVVDEMEECYTKHSIKEIDFFDAVFTMNKKWTLEFCSELRSRKLDLIWSCRARIDNIDEEILHAMEKAGCSRIYYGIETVDADIQTSIKKKTELRHIKNTIRLTKKHNILTLGFFMIGNPGETKRSVMANTRFAKKIGLDYVQFSRTIAKPGSPLFDELKKTVGTDYWSDFVLGKRSDERIPNPWCSLSEEDIEKYTQKAYLSFYLRPRYILESVTKVRSAHEFYRGVKAVVKMLTVK